MKLYKLKPDSDYVTQGEDTDVEKHLNWWLVKYTLIIEKHLIELCECTHPTPDNGECRFCELPLRTEENEL